MEGRIKNFLIIGEPRVGKSTLIESLTLVFGDKIGGFITMEISEVGERRGFEIVTLDGQRARLADRDFESGIRVGKYGVDINNLEKVGVSALEKALREKEIVVIDEIGKMEIASEKFCDIVLKALESNRIVLASVHDCDNPFTNAIKNRKDVRVFGLTIDNRELVRREVINAIKANVSFL